MMPQRQLPIATIVLAAGFSARLGQDKRLLRVGDESVLRRSVRVAIESAIGPVSVVLRAEDAAATGELSGLDVSIITNPPAARGLGSSIRSGLAALVHQQVDGVVLMLCDQLSVTAVHLRAMADLFRERGSPAVASRFAGTIGPPALVGRERFGQLQSVPESTGAKRLLADLGEALVTIDLPGGEIDIDVPTDLTRLA